MDLWDFEQPTYAKATKIRRKRLKACLRQARNLLASIDLQSAPKNNNTYLPESTNKLRWFLLSEEVRRYPQMQTVAALQDPVNLHRTRSFTTKLLWL